MGPIQAIERGQIRVAKSATAIRARRARIRDYANVSQLVCLSNLENLNALFIREGMPQAARLGKLNLIAIQQMQLLTGGSRINRLESVSA